MNFAGVCVDLVKVNSMMIWLTAAVVAIGNDDPVSCRLVVVRLTSATNGDDIGSDNGGYVAVATAIDDDSILGSGRQRAQRSTAVYTMSASAVNDAVFLNDL